MACELMCCHLPQQFSLVSPDLRSRILIRIRQKLDDPSVKSILARIMESWIAVIWFVSDLRLAVSWDSTVKRSASQGSAGSLLAVLAAAHRTTRS